MTGRMARTYFVQVGSKFTTKLGALSSVQNPKSI